MSINIIKKVLQDNVLDTEMYPIKNGQKFLTEKGLYYEDIDNKRIAKLNSNFVKEGGDGKSLLTNSLLVNFKSDGLDSYGLFYVDPDGNQIALANSDNYEIDIPNIEIVDEEEGDFVSGFAAKGHIITISRDSISNYLNSYDTSSSVDSKISLSITDHNTSNQAHSDLRNSIAALQGAFIYRGKINKNTPEVTELLLNGVIWTLLERLPVLGDVLVDNNNIEWYYNGESWNEYGQGEIGLATISNDGLMSQGDFSKLAGIDIGAQKNIQSDWNQTITSADDYIKNKPNISVTNSGSGNAVTSIVSSGHDLTVTKGISFVPFNTPIMPRNAFGGKKIFISHFDNALFNAPLRWALTGVVRNIGTDIITDTLSSNQLSTLFDSNYDGGYTIPANHYLTINLNFNGNFPGGYPYGDVFLSYYHQKLPESATLRVYSNYEPHGLGWHDISFSTYTINSTGDANLIQKAYQGKYAISEMEIIVRAKTEFATHLTEIDFFLNRPNTEEMPVVTKFQPQNIYKDFTFLNNSTIIVKGSEVATRGWVESESVASDSSKLGGELPSYYATLQQEEKNRILMTNNNKEITVSGLTITEEDNVIIISAS